MSLDPLQLLVADQLVLRAYYFTKIDIKLENSLKRKEYYSQKRIEKIEKNHLPFVLLYPKFSPSRTPSNSN